VKRWKLNTARRLLSQSNPSCYSVVEVCTQLGFQHPSQFTQNYKHLFANSLRKPSPESDEPYSGFLVNPPMIQLIAIISNGSLAEISPGNKFQRSE